MKNLLLILTIFSLSLQSCKKDSMNVEPKKLWELNEKLQHNSDNTEQTFYPTPSIWDITNTETCITQNNSTSCFLSSWVNTTFTINGSSYNGTYEVIKHEENVSLWLKINTSSSTWVVLKFIAK